MITWKRWFLICIHTVIVMWFHALRVKKSRLHAYFKEWNVWMWWAERFGILRTYLNWKKGCKVWLVAWENIEDFNCMAFITHSHGQIYQRRHNNWEVQATLMTLIKQVGASKRKINRLDFFLKFCRQSIGDFLIATGKVSHFIFVP